MSESLKVTRPLAGALVGAAGPECSGLGHLRRRGVSYAAPRRRSSRPRATW